MSNTPLTPLATLGASVPAVPTSGGGLTRFTPLDPMRVLRQYMWWLVAAAILGLIAGLTAFYIFKNYYPEFTTNARLAVSGGVVDAWQMPREFGGADERGLATFMQNQILRMTSDEILVDALAREEVRKTRWFQSFPSAREARLNLQRNLSAYQIRGTTLIQANFNAEGEEHRQAMQMVLNAVVRSFLEKYRVDSELQMGEVRRMFVAERERSDADLRRIQEQKARFASENDISTMDRARDEHYFEVSNYATQRTQLEIAMASANAQYNEVMQSLQSGRVTTYTPQEIAELERTESVIATRVERLRNLREARERALLDFGENHRYVKDIDKQVQVIEQEKNRELDRLLRERDVMRLEALKKTRDSLEAQVASVDQKMESSRVKMRDLSQKLRDYQVLEAQEKELQARGSKADDLLERIRMISSRPDNTRIRLLLDAREPVMTSPNFWSVMPTAILMVVGATIGIIFLKELLDQRIKSPAQLRLLPGTELLGVLLDANEDPSGTAQIERVVQKHPIGLMAEAFRQVRTALLSKMDQRGYKTLMVIGAQPESGVSVVVSNLAISLVNNHRRVLVIDANYRRPSQHRLFSTHNWPGLIEVLNGAATLEEALDRNEELGVDVLPAGNAPDAPPELLEGPAFVNLLSQFEGRYDVVLIDAPPALVATDGQVLAKRVDAIAIVVRANGDKRGVVTRMLRQLDGHAAEILGVVLNGVRSSAGGYFRENYQEFYRYRKASIDAAARKRGASADIPAPIAPVAESGNGRGIR